MNYSGQDRFCEYCFLYESVNLNHILSVRYDKGNDRDLKYN
jgi:hypothetical protein